MNQKELSELRRRFRPDKSAISRIYGCYVNTSKEIVSYIDESLGVMSGEEAEKYLSLLKKSLSGQLGKNLIDIVFSTQQVMDSDEHRLLSALRESELKNGDVRQEFYEKVIGALDMGENNYLILLAHDAYDVPHHGKDGVEQEGDSVFSYILCCICPVKNGKPELSYLPNKNEFRSCKSMQLVSAPELGFLFPTFDDRTANIYNALFYSRKSDMIHQEFIDVVFHTEPPMSAAEQREAFQLALTEALEEDCSMDVVQSVYGQLRERIEEHQETKDPEPLAMTVQEVGRMLQNCGVPEEQAAAFQEKCDEQFSGAVLNPLNLIDCKRFEVKTSSVTITMNPEHSSLVAVRVIDGKKYLLIPAEEELEINGMAVGIAGALMGGDIL